MLLYLSFVRSVENPADGPSHLKSSTDYRLTDNTWQNVQRTFGGYAGYTFDLMALDSNVPKDWFEKFNNLPNFKPGPSPGSSCVI